MKSSTSLFYRYLKQSEASIASRHRPSASATSAFKVFSTSAIPQNDSHPHESEKMVSEGGGSTVNFEEKKQEVETKKSGVSDANQSSKHQWQETKESISENANAVGDAAKDKLHQVKESDTAEEAQAAAGKVSEQAKKEVNTSADMMKDTPQKVAETAQGLKEVGIEAAKAVKRDVSHAAEKIGLKNPS